MADEDAKTDPAMPRPVPVPPAAPQRRVTPKPDRPLLPPELEERFAPIDEASARTYEAMEDTGAAVEALTKAIEEGAVRVELEASESLVHIIRAPLPKPTK